MNDSKSDPVLFKKDSLSTRIVIEEELESPHPYCLIPPHYYERKPGRPNEKRVNDNIKPTDLHTVESRTIFSIESWDGRPVVSFSNPED
jgi:hypothetical protein